MEKKTNNPAITKSYAKKMETISPFELKNKLIDMADESIKKIAHTMLNTGTPPSGRRRIGIVQAYIELTLM